MHNPAGKQASFHFSHAPWRGKVSYSLAGKNGSRAALASSLTSEGLVQAMPVVKFIKEKKEIEVPVGANLRKEAIKAGVNTHQGINGFGASLNKIINCHGLGQCGTCRVKIVKGIENASPMGFLEKLRFYNPIPDPVPCMAYIGNEATMRLSCQVIVQGDMEVETGPELNLYGENFFS